MNRPPDEQHGCGPRELAILERTDAGVADADVAAELHVSVAWVRQCRRAYSGSWRENERAEAAIRRGSARYAAALAATGKVYA